MKLGPLLVLLLILSSCDEKPKDLPPEPGMESVTRTTRDVLSDRDKLRASFQSARIMEPGVERDQAIAEVAKKALESAPEMAGAIIREMSPGSGEKDSLIEAYLRFLMEEDKSDAALVWVDSLGDEQDIASARGKVLIMLAQKDPEHATRLLSISEFAADTVSPVTEEVLQTWVLKSPADALAWTSSLPPGEARLAGYRAAFAQWFDTDTKSALTWVDSQGNPSVRQEAVSAMIGLFIAQPDPIRNSMLESVSPNLRAEIEQGIAKMARQSETADPMPEEPAPESETQPQLSE